MKSQGMVPDHWTWRDGVAWVTGYHEKTKGRRQAEPVEVVPTPRGLVSTSCVRKPKDRQGTLL